jgi:hypothetical protein
VAAAAPPGIIAPELAQFLTSSLKQQLGLVARGSSGAAAAAALVASAADKIAARAASRRAIGGRQQQKAPTPSVAAGDVAAAAAGADPQQQQQQQAKHSATAEAAAAEEDQQLEHHYHPQNGVGLSQVVRAPQQQQQQHWKVTGSKDHSQQQQQQQQQQVARGVGQTGTEEPPSDIMLDALDGSDSRDENDVDVVNNGDTYHKCNTLRAAGESPGAAGAAASLDWQEEDEGGPDGSLNAKGLTIYTGQVSRQYHRVSSSCQWVVTMVLPLRVLSRMLLGCWLPAGCVSLLLLLSAEHHFCFCH